MRLVDSIRLNAEAAAVWPLLCNPARMAQWNDKIVAVDGPDRPLRIGERFSILYHMGRRSRHSQCEVVESLPFEKFVLRTQLIDESNPRTAVITYELKKDGGGRLLLRQSVDFRDAGLPWLILPLMWLLHRFGSPVSPGPLQQLARLLDRRPSV